MPKRDLSVTTPAKPWIWKIGLLSGGLGLVTWLLLSVLLPIKLPEDFPKLPDLKSQNGVLVQLLDEADADARRHPSSAENMGRLGMAYHANQFYEQAECAYGIASRLAPEDYRWPYCQALAREESGREKDLPELLRKTIQLKPEFVPALQKLGDIYFKQENLDRATHYYEQSVSASGRDSSLPALVGMGRVAERRRDWHKVIAYAAPLSRDYPHIRAPHQLLLAAYEALGQADKMADEQRKLLEQKLIAVPPVPDALHDNLVALYCSSTRLLKEAGLLSRFGRQDDAIEVAHRAVKIEPEDADVRHFLARTLLETHGDRPEAVGEALAQLAEGLRLRPDDLTPLWHFTSNFFEQGKTDAAVQQLHTILAGCADREEAHYYLGLVADHQGRTQEAVTHYQAALKKDPNHAEANHKLGLILVSEGKLDEAIFYFQKSVRLNPMFALARFNLGLALEQQGKNSQAITQFSEALRLKPNDGPTHMYLAIALIKSGRIDAAVDNFREAVRLTPGDAQAHYGLGGALATQRKVEEAMKELQQALRLRPDYTEARDLLRKLER